MSNKKKQLIPLGKRVILRKDDATETSEGGIVIPEQSREKPLIATVTAVGEETYTLKVGDEVIYPAFAGSEFKIDKREIIVVDEADIMLVLRETSNEHDN